MTDHDHIGALKTAADPQGVAIALDLRGQGNRFFCPLCQPQGGKTPDMTVGDKGFTCNKCGEKGDILKLIMVALDMIFSDAVKWLEAYTGIKPPGRRTKETIEKECQEKIVQPRSNLRAVHTDPGHTRATVPDPAVYEAFLKACRHLNNRAWDWLTKEKGVADVVIMSMRLRFCGHEYPNVIDDLKVRFGEDALRVAGLMKPSRSKPGRLAPSFWHYYINKVGMVVIPYIKDGCPVYLKVRPHMNKEEAKLRGVFRFMDTAAAAPCLYNVDILKGRPGKILICEGESDTWTALSYGFAAVGLPGARGFKSPWVESFRGFQDADGCSTVYLVMDTDKAGRDGKLVIAKLFLKAGLPVPLKMNLLPGMNLTEYMKGEGKE